MAIHMIGLIFILHIPIHCVYGLVYACPRNCDCANTKTYLAIACNTSNPQATLERDIPQVCSHLLLRISENYDQTAFGQQLDFSVFKKLEVLILEAEGLRSPVISLNAASFSQNSNLRIFESNLKLDLTETTFANLRSLEQLALSNTMKNWTFVRELAKASLSDKKALQSLSLLRFSFFEASPGMFNICDTFYPLKDIPLQTLDLRCNKFRLICPCVTLQTGFENCISRLFQSLERLDLSQNDLTKQYWQHLWKEGDRFLDWFEIGKAMYKLRSVDVGEQGYACDSLNPKDFQYLLNHLENPEAKNPISTSTPTATCTELDSFKRTCIFASDVPIGELESLSCNHNKRLFPDGMGFTSFTLEKKDVCIKPLNKLRYISISNMASWNFKQIKHFRFFGFHNLEYLNLQYNDIEELHMDAFVCMSSLKTLLLGGNKFGIWMTSHNKSLNIDRLKNLEVLDLALNSISEMPYNLLAHNNNLRVLNLSDNTLTNFKLNLSNIRYLELIILRRNSLASFESPTRIQLDKIKANLSLDLQNNVLSCGCSELDFIHWWQTTDIIIINKTSHTCIHPNKGQFYISNVNFKDLESLCFPSTTKTIVLSVLLTCSMTTVVVLACVMYCKRWRIRYWLYLARLGWRRHMNNNNRRNYQYDVFVAYNWRDGPWVHGPLLWELETRQGLRLCIHQRDFIPGHVIEEVIVENIANSRKTLLVLSPHFVESNWCHFELQMARNRLFEEGVDALILVILEDLPNGSVNRTLSNLLTTRVYLQWTTNPEGQELFWRQLRDAISIEERPFD